MSQVIRAGKVKAKDLFMYNPDTQSGDGRLTIGDEGELSFLMGQNLMAEFFIQTEDQDNIHTGAGQALFDSLGAPTHSLGEASVVFSPSAEGTAFPYCETHGHGMGANYASGIPVSFYAGLPELVKVTVTVDQGLFVFSPEPQFKAFSVYLFDQSDASNAGHPLKFADEANGSTVTGELRAYGTPGVDSRATTVSTGAQSEYAVSALVTGERSTNGVLLEEPGLMLYSYNDRIYFTAGGTNTVSFQHNADFVESWIEASVSSSNNIKLYLNGVLKDLKVYAAGDVKLDGTGGFDQVQSDTPVTNLGGWSAPGQGAYGGTVHSVKLWPGQRYST
jgi:hypothetical protein